MRQRKLKVKTQDETNDSKVGCVPIVFFPKLRYV